MAIDWTAGMSQTFEYDEVSPDTWEDEAPMRDVASCSIKYDASDDTLGSATISVGSDYGERYVRAYLVARQGAERERVPLGTVLAQTPKHGFDGKSSTYDLGCYTPLSELGENYPPLGYTLFAGTNVMDAAYRAMTEHCRAIVTRPSDSKTLEEDFVANADDTWLTFIGDLVKKASYHVTLDAWGRVGFAPDRDAASMQPVWTYTDDNSSILLPEASVERDLWGIPNVVEVVYSFDDGTVYVGRAVNDLYDSPTSTVSRGREILQRVTDPDFAGVPTQAMVQEMAEQKLAELSSAEYTLTYSHGYCPVHVGDCVRLNYERAGIFAEQAIVQSQDITCSTGCTVAETATFSVHYWGKGN